MLRVFLLFWKFSQCKNLQKWKNVLGKKIRGGGACCFFLFLICRWENDFWYVQKTSKTPFNCDFDYFQNKKDYAYYGNSQKLSIRLRVKGRVVFSEFPWSHITLKDFPTTTISASMKIDVSKSRASDILINVTFILLNHRCNVACGVKG